MLVGQVQVAQDPDKGLSGFLQVFWLTLRQFCLVSDVDVFSGDSGPGDTGGFSGFTLIVRDPHIPTKAD